MTELLRSKVRKKQKEKIRKVSFTVENGPTGHSKGDFEVPEIIDQNKIDASFVNGVLTVTMPKTPEAKKRS